jgi:hypothetical protein
VTSASPGPSEKGIDDFSLPVQVNTGNRAATHKRFYEKVIKVKADVAAHLFLFFVAFATFLQTILR